jgi:hypothetical protein
VPWNLKLQKLVADSLNSPNVDLQAAALSHMIRRLESNDQVALQILSEIFEQQGHPPQIVSELATVFNSGLRDTLPYQKLLDRALKGPYGHSFDLLTSGYFAARAQAQKPVLQAQGARLQAEIKSRILSLRENGSAKEREAVENWIQTWETNWLNH